MNESNINVADETISFYTKVFFQNFQLPSPDQLTNMVTSAMAFADCFEDLEEEKKLLNLILEKPVDFILQKHKSVFTEKVFARMEKNFSLASLEWINFRDTKFRTSLKTEYYADATRPTRHLVTLKDIVTLRGLIKVEIASLFSQMAKKKGVTLRPSLLELVDNRPLQQVGEQ